MILNMIFSLITILITINFIIWFPSVILKSLPKNKKYKNLITQLDKINRIVKKIWSFGFLALNIILKTIASAFVGINIKPIIYAFNSSLGEGYALWASYALAALTFLILPDFFNFKSNKEEVGDGTG